MSDKNISLRERIRLNLISALESAGISQVQFADRLGISKGTVNNWVRGNNSPDVDMVPKICDVLNINVLDLYGDRNDSEIKGLKTAPSGLSEEALGIAHSYARLDDRGKETVKALLNFEIGVTGKKANTPAPSKVTPMPKSRRSKSGITELEVYDQTAAAGLGNYLDTPAHHTEQYPDGVIPSKADFGVVISGNSMEPRIHDGGTVFVQAAPRIEPGQIGIFVLNGQAYCKKLAVDQGSRQIRLTSLNPEYSDIVIGAGDELRTLGRVLGQWTPGYDNDDIFGW